jgi:hypothetical protein
MQMENPKMASRRRQRNRNKGPERKDPFSHEGSNQPGKPGGQGRPIDEGAEVNEDGQERGLDAVGEEVAGALTPDQPSTDADATAQPILLEEAEGTVQPPSDSQTALSLPGGNGHEGAARHSPGSEYEVGQSKREAPRAKPEQEEQVHTEAEVARLHVQLELFKDKELELERLRQEYSALRSQVSEWEQTKTQVAVLTAENTRLSNALAAQIAEREQLAQKEEEIWRREQEVQGERASIEAMGMDWQPERVKELELQSQMLERTIGYLEQKVRDLAASNRELDAIVKQVNPISFNSLKDEVEQLRTENQRLLYELQQREQIAADGAASGERLRQASKLLEQNRQYLQERTTMGLEIERLRAQVAQIETMRSMYVRCQQENQELKATIDAFNDSEKRRQAGAARAFEALWARIDKPLFRTPTPASKVQAWPKDEDVIRQAAGLAKECHFEFDPAYLRWFFAAMRSSRLVILRGFSGVGKSSLPVLMARAIGAYCVKLPVQPSWKSKVDLLGFYNHFDQRFLPTDFAVALVMAQMPAFQNRHVFIILDEMNLSHVEYYFNDFAVKLEDPKDALIELFENSAISGELPKDGIGQYIIDGNKIRIAPNVTFFGTINDDETTKPISDKIYDRSHVINFFGKTDLTGHGVLPAREDSRVPFTFAEYQRGWEARAPLPDIETVEAFLRQVNAYLREHFVAVLGPRSLDQITGFLQAYRMSGEGDDSAALDLAMISKVIPKIRYSHRAGYKQELDDFGKELMRIWPARYQKPFRTKEVLQLMREQA